MPSLSIDRLCTQRNAAAQNKRHFRICPTALCKINAVLSSVLLFEIAEITPTSHPHHRGDKRTVLRMCLQLQLQVHQWRALMTTNKSLGEDNGSKRICGGRCRRNKRDATGNDTTDGLITTHASDEATVKVERKK